MSDEGIRYPIGRFDFKAPFRSEDRPLFLAQLAEEVNWYIRAKLAVTEAQPRTVPYAEQLWAELPDARLGPIEHSLKMFEGVTERWCRLLEALKPEDWSRDFTNAEWGTLTVEDTVRGMAWHTRHHTAQIYGLRDRMTW